MSDKNSEDLLINTLPDKVNEFRNKITNYKPPEKDKYGDGFLTQVYFAAKNSISGSMSSIRKELKLDNLTFQYYMDNNPDFVAAIQIANRMEELDGRFMFALSSLWSYRVQTTTKVPIIICHLITHLKTAWDKTPHLMLPANWLADQIWGQFVICLTLLQQKLN